LEVFLATAALIYTFVYIKQTAGFTISLARASQEVGQHYTENKWAPGTWFAAVLALPLESESIREDIQNHVRIMKTSKWMLIPMFIATLTVVVTAVFGLVQNRRMRGR
jgi:hypothetical protein